MACRDWRLVFRGLAVVMFLRDVMTVHFIRRLRRILVSRVANGVSWRMSAYSAFSNDGIAVGWLFGGSAL